MRLISELEYRKLDMEERDMCKALDDLERIRFEEGEAQGLAKGCLLYTSPSPRDISGSRMPSSA